MRIALTVEEYCKRGGMSRYVAELAEHLAREHEVHVYANTWQDVGNHDIVFHKVPSLPSTLPLVVRQIPFTVQNTLRFNLRNGYDVVHSGGGECLNPDVITAHSIHKAGMEFKKNNREIRGLGFHDIYALAAENINYSYRHYKKIIADASSGKRELMQYYDVPEEDIEVIPLGVDLDEFKPSEPDNDLRKVYGIQENDVVLIIVATEFSRKGVVELIEAMKMLYNSGQMNIKLLIVGDARIEGVRKDSSFYVDLVRQHGLDKDIIFTGPRFNVRGGELTKHYNLADIFVFPTKYEGFGLPTVEAMACGLPVIVGPSGAGEDLISDGWNGFLLEDVNDPKEIAELILTLSQNEKLRRMMGRAARETAKTCSWDIIAKRTAAVYEEVAA